MKKRFVYSSQRGFLLIEHLIALMITGILTTVTLSLLHVIKGYTIEPTRLSQHEVETFTSHLQKEAQRAHSISINQQKLMLHFSDASVTSYFIQNNRLMRQANGKGGEIALYNCTRLEIEFVHDQSAHLKLTSNQNDTYDVYLSLLSLPLQVPPQTDSDEAITLTPTESVEDVIMDENEIIDETEIKENDTLHNEGELPLELEADLNEIE